MTEREEITEPGSLPPDERGSPAPRVAERHDELARGVVRRAAHPFEARGDQPRKWPSAVMTSFVVVSSVTPIGP